MLSEPLRATQRVTHSQDGLDINAISSSVASSNQDWKQKPLQRGKSSPADDKGDKLTKLVTDRLLLREFVEKDWQTVLAYQSEKLSEKRHERANLLTISRLIAKSSPSR